MRVIRSGKVQRSIMIGSTDLPLSMAKLISSATLSEATERGERMTTSPRHSHTARSIARSQRSLGRMSSWSTHMAIPRSRRSWAKRNAMLSSSRE